MGWIALSSWWYVNQIKGINTSSISVGKPLNDLIINLDGNEKMSFDVTSSKDGIISFQNQMPGQSIGMVKSYLENTPDKNISINGSDENVIHSILASFKLIGIDEERLHYTLLSDKHAETEIIAINNPNYHTRVDSIDTDSLIVKVDDAVSETAAGDDQTDLTVIPENTSPREWIPCPDVNTKESYPRIEYILFGTASYKVSCPDALKQYAKAAKKYLDDKGGKIVITGHTDKDQRQVNNLSLGLKRASEVKKYMMRYGIPSDRIETYSRGDSEPIGDNNTAAGKQLNRRVTIELQ
ncbi:MAG: OmpA family protein [Bacteroidetes bacterium]|nr:OmpA family protein [Bacteroidota bacterium]